MNKERILHLADAIETGSEILGFNMNYEYATLDDPSCDKSDHGCGTVACILGWTVHLFCKRPTLCQLQDRHLAASLLAINEDKAYHLFYPSQRYGVKYSEVTPQKAARVLRHLAETGKVDWSVA